MHNFNETAHFLGLGSLHPLTALQEALDLGEITSTTTGLDLEHDSDSSSSQSDDDLSTTMDMNESRNIRRQLEGLESMYSEVNSLNYFVSANKSVLLNQWLDHIQ